MFTLKIGEDFHFDEHIFQMGWNHQPVGFCLACCKCCFCEMRSSTIWDGCVALVCFRYLYMYIYLCMLWLWMYRHLYVYIYNHEYICVYMQIYCMTKPTLVDDQNYILIDAYRWRISNQNIRESCKTSISSNYFFLLHSNGKYLRWNNHRIVFS